MEIELMNKPIYGVVDRGIFGVRVVTGIITGVQFTDNLPLYKIEYKDGSVWTDKVTDNVEKLLELMSVIPLKNIPNLLVLKTKFK